MEEVGHIKTSFSIPNKEISVWDRFGIGGWMLVQRHQCPPVLSFTIGDSLPLSSTFQVKRMSFRKQRPFVEVRLSLNRRVRLSPRR